MTNEKIINRINNLLSKTVENGCTPEEAAAAAAKAQELIAKHHVNMRDAGEENEEIGACIESAVKTWQHNLAHIIAENTCCKVIITADRKQMVFMGRETDLEAVLSLYDKLTDACKQGIKQEKARMKELYGTTAKVETSYALGFLQAVREEMGKQCRALQLITPEDVTAKFTETFPNAVHTRSRRVQINRGVFDRGHAAGRQQAGRQELSC